MSKLDEYYREYCSIYDIEDERNRAQVRSYIRECMEGRTENLANDDHNPIFFKTVMFGAAVAIREGHANIIAHMAERFLYHAHMFELMKGAFETGHHAFFDAIRTNEDDASVTVKTYFDMYTNPLFLNACQKNEDQFDFAKWLIDWLPQEKIAPAHCVDRLFTDANYARFDTRLVTKRLSLDTVVQELPEPEKDHAHLTYRAICCDDVPCYDALKQKAVVERAGGGKHYSEIQGYVIAALHHSPDILQDLLETSETKTWPFEKLVGLSCVAGHPHALKLFLDHGLTTEHGHPRLDAWGMEPCENTLKIIKADKARQAFIRSDVAEVALENFLAAQEKRSATEVLTLLNENVRVLDAAVHRGALNRLLDPKIWDDPKTAYKVIKDNTPSLFRQKYQQEFDRFESQISIHSLKGRKKSSRAPKLG